MNWGKSQQPQQPQAGPSGGEDGRKLGAPPPCPRCDVTKSQFTRTLQNYQKAYRKKVEGLKNELKATRNTNESLRRQVKQLKSPLRLHAPSLVLGVAAGLLIKTYAASIGRLFRRGGSKQEQQEGQGDDQQQAAAAAAGAASGDAPGAPQLS